MLEKMFTVDEVAEMASVTSRTVRNYIKEGKLHGHKLGGQWRFPETEVQRLLYGGIDSSPQSEPSAKTSSLTSSSDAIAEETPSPQRQMPSPKPSAEPQEPVLKSSPCAPAAAAISSTVPVTEPPSVEAPPSASTNTMNVPSIPPSTLPRTEAPVVKNTAPPQHSIPTSLSGLPSVPPAASPAPVTPPPTHEQEFLVTEEVQPFIQPFQDSNPNISPVAEDEAFYSSLQEETFSSSETAYRPSSSYQPIAPNCQLDSFPQEPPSSFQRVSAPSASPPQAYSAAYAQQENVPASSYTSLPFADREAPRGKSVSLNNFELSDVGKRVAQFTAEVHDCSNGAQICMVYDVHQSLAAAKITSDKIAQIAAEQSSEGIPCLSFVEFDARYYIARYTLFGSSPFLSICLEILGA